MARLLKYRLNDTTLTSNLNQELSNLLSQTNKTNKKVTVVSAVATRALAGNSSPISLEDLSDVKIYLPTAGQAVVRNNANTGWVNSAVGAPNLDGFFSGGFPISALGYAVTGGSVSTTINQITAFLFILNNPITITRVSCNVTALAAASSVNLGIYDRAGNRLLDSGAIASTSTGKKTIAITAITLQPGTYYFAQSVSNTAVQLTVFQQNSTILDDLVNQNGLVKIGQAANLTAGGVMPATLGVITADSIYPNMAAALFGTV